MRVARAEVYPVRIPRRAPLVLAYATRTAARSVLLRLVADDGREGWGEAAPVAEVSGERATDVREALRRVAEERLPGLDPVPAEPARQRMARDLARLPSARCAVETALLDLRGQALGVPAATLLGGARTEVRASVTIGLLDRAATVAAARARLAEGFLDLKLKLGGGTAADADRVHAVRDAVGPGVRLFLDANQAYDADGALALLRAVAPANPEFVEQPVPARDLDALATVSRASPVPVMADEAVTDFASLAALLARRAVPLVNLKVQKCGGPLEAVAMARAAEAAGVGAMIGCMTETRIGIAAGLAASLGAGNVRYVDLDGAFDLDGDPVTDGGPERDGARQAPGRGPGLGLAVDAAALARWHDDDPEAP